MTRPTLVTGAAGFAGSHLLAALAGRSTQIVAWHRPGHAPPDAGAAVWTPVDLLDRSSVIEALGRIKPAFVYHCAGAAHVGRAWAGSVPTFATNVRGTQHLLEGLRVADADVRVLIPSSALVYRPSPEAMGEDHALAPDSPYGLSKLAQELLASHTSSDRVQVAIARAFNHTGPGQDPAFAASGFARQIAEIEAGRATPEIVVGNLDARRDLADVRDTVRAYRLVAERGHPRRPYNVCSGHAWQIRDILDMLLARARVPIRVRVDSARFRPNDVPLLLGDPSRIRDELGWTPQIPLEQTLAETLEYWRAPRS